MLSLRLSFPFFKQVLIFDVCHASSWEVFREIEAHSGIRNGCHVSTFGSGCDNFIGIRANSF